MIVSQVLDIIDENKNVYVRDVLTDELITYYIDYEGLGKAIVNDGWYYELYDGRVVQYNY